MSKLPILKWFAPKKEVPNDPPPRFAVCKFVFTGVGEWDEKNNCYMPPPNWENLRPVVSCVAFASAEDWALVEEVATND